MTSTVTIIHATSSATKTPGPGAYMPPSSFGNESPRYSIKNRYPQKQYNTDGSYQAYPSTIGTGRKYSFGVRPKDLEKPVTPGPSYVPPAFGSDGQKSSFHAKQHSRKVESSPGPLTYEDATRSQSPRYSMKARQFPKNDGESCSPGPGKYLPDYDKVLPGTRKTAFTSRHPDPKRESTPGPYYVPYPNDAKQTSFHRKRYEPKPDQTPGPKYDVQKSIGSDARKNSIHLRIEQKQSLNTAPYQKVPDLFGNAPKYSFSIRPKNREIVTSPGPNYVPPAFGSDAHKSAFHSKAVERKNETSPGPYTIPDESNGRKYSMKGRNFIKNEGSISGPGPGKYLPNFDPTLPASPKTSIRMRLDSNKKPQQGPGYYLLPEPSGPKITIGVKDGTTILPGSN